MTWKTYCNKSVIGTAFCSFLFLQPALASSGHESMTHDADMPAQREVVRTVELTARDIEFSLGEIAVKPGETVRFVIRNEGELAHDFTIGNAETQNTHRMEMQAMMSSDSGHHGHGMSNAVMIEPGETVELVWTFGEETDIQFGCNIPGHFEAGMAGKFDIQS